MIKKMLATASILLSIVTVSAFGICFFDEPVEVEAAVGFPEMKNWDNPYHTPYRQISVEVSDCVRFGVTNVGQIPKTNSNQDSYNNNLYVALYGQYHTANENSMVFYGYGGGTSYCPGTSTYYNGVRNYTVSNTNASDIARRVADGEDEKSWLGKLVNSSNTMKKREYYYTNTYGGINGTVEGAHDTFNRLRNNLLTAYPTYTDLLFAFYYEDEAQGLVYNGNFVSNLVNNCGLNQYEAQYAMGYWLGNQCNLDTNSLSANAGTELAFYNACTGNDWTDGNAVGMDAAYKRMLSLLSMYVVSIRAGSGYVSNDILLTDYFDYTQAIIELVNPEAGYITYAPCIESTIEIVYNPNGVYDIDAGVPEYEFTSSGITCVGYKEKKGAWTFAGADGYSNERSTITLTTAQQFAILSGRSVAEFCGQPTANTWQTIINIMGNGQGTPWAVKNSESGLTSGIWMQYSEHDRNPVNLCDKNSANPGTQYMVWGFSDHNNHGAHFGCTNVTCHLRDHYYDTIWDSIWSSDNTRLDGRTYVYECDANVTYVDNGYNMSTGYCNPAGAPGPMCSNGGGGWSTTGPTGETWYAACSWKGRDGDVDSAIDCSPYMDMTSLFTMYQYVYGFNMYYQHINDSYVGMRGLPVNGGSCPSWPGGVHRNDDIGGDYMGYAGINNDSTLLYSNTYHDNFIGQRTSNDAAYMTAIPNTNLFGFKCYITGAVWTPTLTDAEMCYTVTTSVEDSAPAGISQPSGDKSWEYGYLDNDTFKVKNTITVAWDTSTPEKARKFWLLRNNALLVNRLCYYGPVSGIRVRMYTYADDVSNYCGTQPTRYLCHSGHYRGASETVRYYDGAHYLYSAPTAPGSGITPHNESRTLNIAWNEGQTARYLDSFWYIRDTVNPDRRFTATEVLEGSIFPQENITFTYNISVDLWYSGGIPYDENYVSRNQNNSGVRMINVNNWGGKTIQLTRTTQYFSANSGTDALSTTDELKEGSPNNERYEAMAGVPTINSERQTESMYFSVGGVPYAATVTYHTEFNKPLNGYNQCNYVYIDSCDVYEMDSAKVTGTGDLLEVNEVNLGISDKIRSDTRFNIDVKLEQAKAVSIGGSIVRVTGDSIYAKDKNGNWVPLFTSYYDADYNGSNLRYGYDSIRGVASEKQLAIDYVHNSYPSVWASVYPSRNSKTNLESVHNWTRGTGVLGDFRGYSGVQNSNKYSQYGAPIYMDGLTLKRQIENKQYGRYNATVTYGVYRCNHNSALSRINNYISYPKYISSYPNGKTNEVIVQDPIAVKYSVIASAGNSTSHASDVMRSYNNSANSVDSGGEPYDQRIGAARSIYDITDANHLFIDYDFAIKLDYRANFGSNNASYLNSMQSMLGKGFSTGDVTTSPWIGYVWVKFPFAVRYNNVDYNANTWIVLESPVNASSNSYSLDRNTTTKTYNGFHIPLYQGELNDGTVEVKVQGVNSPNTNATSLTDSGANYSTYNKTRVTASGKSMWANRQSHATQNKVDVVGHIGAMTLLDTGDFRFSNYFKKTTSVWLVDGLLKQVDVKKQNGIVTDDVDVLRKTTGFGALDPYQSLAFVNNGTNQQVTTNKFPLSTSILADNLKSQPIKLGYSLYMSLETIGNYTGNQADNSQVEIKPRYYYVSTSGTVTPVDVYMPINGKYVLVNENATRAVQNPNLYEYFYTLDWSSEKDRRMYTASPNEMNATGSDEPSNAKTVHIGNLDYIFLRSSARTYFGNQAFNGNVDAGDKKAQRWHFTLGLPSGAVFVKAGETPKLGDNLRGIASNILDGSDGGYVICTTQAVSKGNTWILQYNHNDQSLPSRGGVPGIPDGSIPDPEIPVLPVDPGESASSDLSVQGTH